MKLQAKAWRVASALGAAAWTVLQIATSPAVVALGLSLAGAVAACLGIDMLFGRGWALIAGGVLCIAGAVVIARGQHAA